MSDTYKTAKINFITSWAVNILRTAYYIHGPSGDEINCYCFICVTQRRALRVVIKRQFVPFISDKSVHFAKWLWLSDVIVAEL